MLVSELKALLVPYADDQEVYVQVSHGNGHSTGYSVNDGVIWTQGKDGPQVPPADMPGFILQTSDLNVIMDG